MYEGRQRRGGEGCRGQGWEVGTPDKVTRLDVAVDEGSLVEKLDGEAERFAHLEHL